MDTRAEVKLEDFDALFNGASAEIESMFTSGHSVQKLKYPVEDIDISMIDNFPDHPFRIIDDCEMEKLTESILSEGVLNPVIVRKTDNSRYQMISGHRRLYACKKAGFSYIPGRVMELNNDLATIIMIDANFLQRKNISPSEKARAYKKKYEAMKHQGCNGEINDTYAEIGKALNESGKTVQRFCHLCELSDELLDMIDSKRLGLSSGFEASYMSEDDQNMLAEFLKNSDMKIKKSQAIKLKEISERGELTEEIFDDIVNNDSKDMNAKLNEGRIRAYFPTDISIKEIEEKIVELLIAWKGESNG